MDLLQARKGTPISPGPLTVSPEIEQAFLNVERTLATAGVALCHNSRPVAIFLDDLIDGRPDSPKVLDQSVRHSTFTRIG
ncbi:hypothetical protein [Phyllobacterium ifriqiyense]|uniref:hypothetical protein n=1 Tax=Phyllobacterium ifriqiyense TaxID=314238 RepID=UPI0033976EBA